MKTTTENVKQVIQELFSQNFNLYPESYPLNADGSVSNEAKDAAENVARQYYAVRTDEEIDRDSQLNINEEDYVSWCVQVVI